MRNLIRRWADRAVVKDCDLLIAAADMVRKSAEKRRNDMQRDLIKSRADVDRLTQQLTRANAEFAAEQQRHHNTESNLKLIADGKWNSHKLHIQRLEDQAAKDRESIEQLDRELREANATIDGLGLEIKNYERAIDRAQTIADETRAKRYYDGLGDQ